MSEPSLLRGQYVNILLGNGAQPEVFTITCGITTRTFTEQVNTSDVITRDCALPENIPVRRVNVTSQQWDLSGTGLLNRAQLAAVRTAKGVTRNWRFEILQPTTDAVYGGYFAGPAMLDSISYGATDGEFVTIDLSMKSDGTWNFVTVP